MSYKIESVPVFRKNITDVGGEIEGSALIAEGNSKSYADKFYRGINFYYSPEASLDVEYSDISIKTADVINTQNKTLISNPITLKWSIPTELLTVTNDKRDSFIGYEINIGVYGSVKNIINTPITRNDNTIFTTNNIYIIENIIWNTSLIYVFSIRTIYTNGHSSFKSIKFIIPEPSSLEITSQDIIVTTQTLNEKMEVDPTGNLVYGSIPLGYVKGDTGANGQDGESFNVDYKQETIIERDSLTGVVLGETCFVSDTSLLYFAIASGGGSSIWDSGVEFGKGKDAAFVVMANDSINVPTDANGSNFSYANITSYIQVFIGGVSTTSFTYGALTVVDGAFNIVNNYVICTALYADFAYCIIPITVAGYQTMFKTFSVVKQKQGILGLSGSNGQTTYLHTKYSNDGALFTDNGGNDIGDWLGTLTDFIETASSNFDDYTWKLIKGTNGTDGINGSNGVDGEKAYLHIKYSNDGGSTFTLNNGDDVGSWMGTYSDNIETASLDVNFYKWVLIKGEQGDTGLAGENGQDASGYKILAINGIVLTNSTDTTTLKASSFSGLRMETLISGDIKLYDSVGEFGNGYEGVVSFSQSKEGFEVTLEDRTGVNIIYDVVKITRIPVIDISAQNKVTIDDVEIGNSLKGEDGYDGANGFTFRPEVLIDGSVRYSTSTDYSDYENNILATKQELNSKQNEITSANKDSVKTILNLNSVENKTSAEIRDEITTENLTNKVTAESISGTLPISKIEDLSTEFNNKQNVIDTTNKDSVKTTLELNNVENKTSATIRSEITSENLVNKVDNSSITGTIEKEKITGLTTSLDSKVESVTKSESGLLKVDGNEISGAKLTDTQRTDEAINILSKEESISVYKNRGISSFLKGASTRIYVPMENKINLLRQDLIEDNSIFEASSVVNFGDYGLFGGHATILDQPEGYIKVNEVIRRDDDIGNINKSYYAGNSIGAISFWYNHQVISNPVTNILYDDVERVLFCLYMNSTHSDKIDKKIAYIVTSRVDSNQIIHLSFYIYNYSEDIDILDQTVNTGILNSEYNHIVFNINDFLLKDFNTSIFLNSIQVTGLDSSYDYEFNEYELQYIDYVALGMTFDSSVNLSNFRSFANINFNYDEFRMFSDSLLQAQIDSIYNNPMVDNMLSAFLISNYRRYIESTSEPSSILGNNGDIQYKYDTGGLFIKTSSGIKEITIT